MDDRRDERRLGAGLERLGQVLSVPRAAGGDHRNGDRTRDRRGELEVVAVARPVGVDRGEQDLAGAAVDRLARPLNGIPAAGRAAAVRDDLTGPGVDRTDNGLGAELGGERGQELRAIDGSLVDRDLVGPGPEQAARVLEARDPAADRERDLQFGGRLLDEREHGPAAFDRRGDVEKDQLVGAERRVARRELDRVPHLAQALEAHSLDDAAARDVEARDHALLDHATAFARTRAPGEALRSGWNWTPATAPRSTAATTAPSCSTSATTTPSAGSQAKEWAK